MRAAHGDDGDAGFGERVLDLGERLRERGLGEAVVAVDAEVGGAHAIHHRAGGAARPSGGERVQVAPHAEDPMAQRAVALARGAVAGEERGDLGVGARPDEQLLEQVLQWC